MSLFKVRLAAMYLVEADSEEQAHMAISAALAKAPPRLLGTQACESEIVSIERSESVLIVPHSVTMGVRAN